MIVADERLEHGALLVGLQKSEFHDSVSEERQVAQRDEQEPLELERDCVEVKQHVQVAPHLLLPDGARYR